jgi:hypothetical protein
MAVENEGQKLNFESEPKKELSPKEKLEIFRSEIQSLKDLEMAKKIEWEKRSEKGMSYDAHFDSIAPSELNSRDMGIYDKFKNKTIIRDEMVRYREEIIEKMKSKEISVLLKDPRYNFYMFLINKIGVDKEIRKKWGI